ncbi:MAG: hypothetical protein ACI8W8_000359 [Rhodothermales bacterium]|jgi:uncharacterized protein (DUF1800 family)
MLSFTWGAAAQIDQDGDGISDIWRLRYSAEAVLGSGDNDADGILNSMESDLGTDPFSADATPALTLQTATGSRLLLSTPSFPNKEIQVYESITLVAPVWTLNTAVRNATTIELPAASADKYFKLEFGDYDTDGDTLTDWEEIELGTDPTRANTRRRSDDDREQVDAALGQVNTVTIHAFDGSFHEDWPSAGRMAVRRSGGLRPLTVNIALSGTATAGADYADPGTTVTIPLGRTEVVVEFAPIADSAVEGDETLIATVAAGANYVVGAESSAQLTLNDGESGQNMQLLRGLNGGGATLFSIDLAGAGAIVWLAGGATINVANTHDWTQPHNWVFSKTAAGGLAIYVDGALWQSIPAGAGSLAGLSSIVFGGDADPFLGTLDNVRIYDRELSTAEIATLNAVPSLAFSGTAFAESAANDGSIDESLTITLASANFAASPAAGIAIVGLPAGLAANIARDSATQLTLSLTGNAIVHAGSTNLTLVFADSAFDVASSMVKGARQDLSIWFTDAAAIAVDDAFGAASVAAPGVLANDTSATSAQKLSDPVFGSVVLNADGSFVYTPTSPGFTGIDTFTYQAVGASTSAPARALITVGDADLQLWYPFAGSGYTAYDHSGWGRNGAMEDSLIRNAGIIDFANEGTITVPTSAFSATAANQALTVTIRAKSSIDRTTIIGAVDSDQHRQLNIHLPWNNSQVYFDAGDDTGAFDRINESFPDDTMTAWQHWAFTKDVATGEMYIYLNGVQVDSGTGRTRPFDEVVDLVIGRSSPDRNYEFLGELSDIRLYGRALSPAEIANLVTQHAVLTPNASSFAESASDDGSIGNTLTFSLLDGVFAADVASHVSFANLPAGLTPLVERLGNTELRITLNGTSSANSVANLGISFSDSAFTGLTAAQVYGSSRSDLSVDFISGAAVDDIVEGFTLAAPGVLANDGGSGDAAKLSEPADGSVVLNADGSLVYTPGGGFSGVDSFTYNRGGGSAATVTIVATRDTSEIANFAFDGADASADSSGQGNNATIIGSTLAQNGTLRFGDAELTVGSGLGSVDSAISIAFQSEASNDLPGLKAASRFLQQASFGPTRARIDEVANMGIEKWIDQQIALPASSLKATMEGPSPAYFNRWREPAWWYMCIENDDTLRQRMAYALSQILVISDNDGSLNDERAQPGVAHYYDIFLKHGFGNYRDILFQVTTHPVMGYYLSHVQNKKPDDVAGTFPDENYAREVMQLFTIGLWELNTDGSLKLDGANEPIPTYSNVEIQEFARVFTGQSYLYEGESPLYASFSRNITSDDGAGAALPMGMWEEHHDTDAKQLLAYPGAANSGALPAFVDDPGRVGMDDINDAVDNLFNHPNVGPFVCYRLIQRMVTSNPTPAYLGRVASVFNDNGEGVRGDMGAVVKALLLDDEARGHSWMSVPSYGKLREPHNRHAHMVVAFNVQPFANTENGAPRYYHIGRMRNEINQAPNKAPSVFNFHEPNYQPPGVIRDNDLFAPEFQILSETWATKRANSTYNRFDSSPNLGVWNENPVDYTYEYSIGDDIDALIDYLDLLMCYGKLSNNSRQILHEILTREDDTDDRVRMAIYIIGTSPEFSVLK